MLNFKISKKLLKSALFMGVVFSSIAAKAATTMSPNLSVMRLNNGEPIITKDMFLAIDPGLEYQGKNINGPCMVRIPDWVASKDRAHPSAIYYLYFAHHGDGFIRMAWAQNIEGPYTLYNTHTNEKDLQNGDTQNGRGVLDLGTKLQKSGKPEMVFKGRFKIKNNIASPDVILDHKNKQFIMFFHGHAAKPTYDSSVANTGKQKSFVATSRTGLNFNMPDDNPANAGGVNGGESGHGIRVAHLGNAYFRTFQYDGELYAFSNYGPVWKAPSLEKPWDTSHIKNINDDVWTEMADKKENPIARAVKPYKMKHRESPIAGFNRGGFQSARHFATLLQGDNKTLEVWYTARGDRPERIFRTTIDLSQNDWNSWETSIHDLKDIHQEMLRPELEWEGANQPLAAGKNGQTGFMNAMRDPDLFRDADGQVYLFYVGGGESAIGIARVNGF
ncbi:MAG: hypothetical protein ACPGN3_01230 [Opitutales bacterium]